MAWVINKKNVRSFALEISRRDRGGRFKRVSGQFMIDINSMVMEAIKDKIQRHPSVGITIK